MTPATSTEDIDSIDHPQLSFAQQRLWLLDRYEGGDPVFNIPAAVRMSGALDVDALRAGLDDIIARHEPLRTTFSSGKGVPLQHIHEPTHIDLAVVNLGHLIGAPREARLQELLSEAARCPFDLSRGLMLRAHLFHLAPEQHVLLFVMHHISSDGWSIGVFFEELGASYAAHAQNATASATDAGADLPELSIQYADFAEWQRERLQGDLLAEQLAYWQSEFADPPPFLEIPSDRPRPAIRTNVGDRVSTLLSSDLSHALEEFGLAHGYTPFMLLFAGYAALLQRYTGQEDFVIGAPIAGRKRVETEPLIGLFVNTLALRIDLTGDPTFEELLGRVRRTTLGAYMHQDLPFERLVEELQPTRELSHTPLFQVALAFQNAPSVPLELTGLELESFEVNCGTSNYDLTFFVETDTDGYRVIAEYSADLFDRGTVERILASFRTLLEAALATPEKRIAALPILDEAALQQVLVHWNDTRSDYPRDSSIAREFEARVEEAPDNVAAVFVHANKGMPALELTYAELNSKANRIAHRLIELGVGKDDLVGLCAERGMPLVVGILGILKSGGAYLPLDPGYPPERLGHMLEDAAPRILLAENAARDKLTDFAGTSLPLDARLSAFPDTGAGNPAPRSGARDLAYVMFTSGSSGRPKGVCIEQRSVLRLVMDPNFCDLGPDEVLLHLAPISFDASTFEMWGALLRGARMVVCPSVEVLLEGVGTVIREQGVTTAWLTAGLFSLMVDYRLEDLRGLGQLLAGGDVLPLPQVERLRNELPELRLINGYGPTENTTFACCHLIPSAGSIGTSVPIGKPVSDTRAYILDAERNPVPIGVPGQLFVGGDGVARGYLKRPEKTAERFLPDPYSKNSEDRLYDTGDQARWLADGTIEFLGRRDNQIKLRGYRIELGEVESILSASSDVRDCVAILREDAPGDKRIVAYVVPSDAAIAGGTAQDGPELRAFAKRSLPGYMIPAHFVSLDSLPLSPNGKVDRGALPSPDPSLENDVPYAAPSSDVARRIARIWEEVLNMERIGVHDNFFALGGHSLGASVLINNLGEEFALDLPLRLLFAKPTVEELSAAVEECLAASSHEERKRAGSGVAERLYQDTFDSSLIPIQPKGERQPLFMVSGAHSKETDFLRFVGNLLAHLQDQPIYGFKARGLDGRGEPHSSVREMAADYVREMRQFQPEGPYLLAGNCVGGVVAFEMAQQLRALGEEAALVALLDATRPSKAYVDEVDRLFKYWKRDRLERHLGALRERSLVGKLTYLLGKGCERIAGALSMTRKGREKRRARSVERRYSSLIARHVLEPYGGKLTLIISKEMHEETGDAGWSDVAEGGLITHVVPGDHVTRLTAHPGAVAKDLKSSIDEALATWRPRDKQDPAA